MRLQSLLPTCLSGSPRHLFYRTVLLGVIAVLCRAEVALGAKTNFAGAEPADWQVWSVCGVVLAIFGAFCLAGILRSRRAIQVCGDRVREAEGQSQKAQQQLDCFREQLRGVIDSVDQGIAVIDKDFVIQHTNEGLLKIFGITGANVTGASCRDHFCKISPLGCSNCPGEKSLSTLQGTEDLLDSVSGDGGKVVIRRRTSIFKDKKGKPAGFILLVEDVSQRYHDD